MRVWWKVDKVRITITTPSCIKPIIKFLRQLLSYKDGIMVHLQLS